MEMYNPSEVFPVGGLNEDIKRKLFNNVAHEINVALGADSFTRGPVKLFDKSIAQVGNKFVALDKDGKPISYHPDRESAIKALLTINMAENVFGKSIKEENGKFVVYDGDKPINSFPDRASALEAQARIEIGKLVNKAVEEWETWEPNDVEYQMAVEFVKTSGKVMPNGRFKEGFAGCVAHMKNQGKSDESANKLCAYIGRQAGKIKGISGNEDDMYLQEAMQTLANALNARDIGDATAAIRQAIAAVSAAKEFQAHEMDKGKAGSAVMQPGTGATPSYPGYSGGENPKGGPSKGQVQPSGSASDKAPTRPDQNYNGANVDPADNKAVVQPGPGATPSNPGYTGEMKPAAGKGSAVGQPGTGANPSYDGYSGAGKVPTRNAASAVGGSGGPAPVSEGLPSGKDNDQWSNKTPEADRSVNPNASMLHLGKALEGGTGESNLPSAEQEQKVLQYLDVALENLGTGANQKALPEMHQSIRLALRAIQAAKEVDAALDARNAHLDNVQTNPGANAGVINPAAGAEHGAGVYKSSFKVTKGDNGVLEWTIDFPITKLDDEKRLVGGVVYEPDIIDAQGDSASEHEIEKAAHKFMLESRTLGLMHKEEAGPRAQIVESYITPANLRIGNQNVRKGTWMMVVKVNDEDLWKMVKGGKITGFSMGGRARETAEELANQ